MPEKLEQQVNIRGNGSSELSSPRSTPRNEVKGHPRAESIAATTTELPMYVLGRYYGILP